MYLKVRNIYILLRSINMINCNQNINFAMKQTGTFHILTLSIHWEKPEITYK